MLEANGVGLHAQPLSIQGRSMVILYGTETGSSEEIARELGEMAERLHFKTVVDEMNSFSLVRWPPVSLSSPASVTDHRRSERPSPVHSGCICLVNNWTGRYTWQCGRVLEESSKEETSTWLFRQRQVYHLWTWRQLVPEVQLGGQEASQTARPTRSF